MVSTPPPLYAADKPCSSAAEDGPSAAANKGPFLGRCLLGGAGPGLGGTFGHGQAKTETRA